MLGRIAELKREKKFSVVDDNDDIGDCINKGEVKLLLWLPESSMLLLVVLHFNCCSNKSYFKGG